MKMRLEDGAMKIIQSCDERNKDISQLHYMPAPARLLNVGTLSHEASHLMPERFLFLLIWVCFTSKKCHKFIIKKRKYPGYDSDIRLQQKKKKRQI